MGDLLMILGVYLGDLIVSIIGDIRSMSLAKSWWILSLCTKRLVDARLAHFDHSRIPPLKVGNYALLSAFKIGRSDSNSLFRSRGMITIV